jgi:preprotein translocase subunit YajC
MSLLDYLLITLAIIIPGGIPIYLLWRYQNKKALEAEEKLRKSAEGLANALVEAAAESLKDAEIKTSPSGVKYKTAESKYLSNAKYLITLITAIVKKEGTIRLNEQDFINVTKEDYISLYIDLKTNDIILAANQTGAPEEISPRVYDTPEEDIYH